MTSNGVVIVEGIGRKKKILRKEKKKKAGTLPTLSLKPSSLPTLSLKPSSDK